jgi:hypothetical protein
MYFVYAKTSSSGITHYAFKSQSHIFGRNVGLVPRLLRTRISPNESQPSKWHVSVETILAERSEVFLINLKPNNPDKRNSLSLYELRDVWGFSASGWTPAMLRLRGLCIDGEPEISDPRDFSLRDQVRAVNEAIYSFVYFQGTIQEGTLVGPWTPPRASSTNSVLLWPYVLSYFVDAIRSTTPAALNTSAA